MRSAAGCISAQCDGTLTGSCLASLAPAPLACPTARATAAALDAWMQIKRLPDADRTRLGAVADGADDNAWRRQFRQAALSQDMQKLKALAGQAEALAQFFGRTLELHVA